MSSDSTLKTSEKTTEYEYHLRELRLFGIFCLFSIVGVLARKGLISLTSYEGSYLGGVVWANFGSCIVMGCANGTPTRWYGNTEKRSILLYIGITTGFCGTFSSFASMILEAFVRSANIVPETTYHFKTSGYGVMEALSVLIGQMGISVAGFKFGENIATDLSYLIRFDERIIMRLENLIIIGGVIAWVAVTCLMAVKNWRSWTFACVISPIACWLRYYISKKLNPISPSFPFGTFTVNIFATAILAVLELLNRGRTSSGGSIVTTILSCQIIEGLNDGFCGTLSTVSTFVNELNTLKFLERWRYALTSIVASYILMVLILGSYNWSVGLTDSVC